MTIHRTIRDAFVEIVLTEEELWHAYNTERIKLTAEDIKERWEDTYSEPFPYPDAVAWDMSDSAWDGMYGSDYFMDCYWEFIDNVIHNYKEASNP